MGTSVRQNAPSAAAATADGASPVAAETRPRNGGGDASTTAAYFFTTSEDAAYVFATFSRRSRVGDGYGSFAGGGGDVGDDVVVVDVGFFWSRSFAAFAFAFFASSRFSCFAIARSRPSSVSAVNTLGAIFIGSDVTAAPASFTDAIADDQKRSTPACHSSAAIALPSSLRLVSIAACFASAGRGCSNRHRPPLRTITGFSPTPGKYLSVNFAAVSGPFPTKRRRGGVQRRQVALKGVAGGD
jgi:hypothetical protein